VDSFEELVNNYPVEYIAGGGTQNVMRSVAVRNLTLHISQKKYYQSL
jgi:hypothetical protein